MTPEVAGATEFSYLTDYLDQITRTSKEEDAADEELDKLAEFTDAKEFAREVLGVKVLTGRQEQFLDEIVEHDFRGRWLLRGGNGSCKTGAEVFGLLYAWGPMACRVVDGSRVGCLLLLSAPKASSIQATVYSQLVRFGAIAAERGYPLPGWEPRKADRYFGASDKTVNWNAYKNHWQMDTLIASPTAAKDVSHGLSGRHHPGMQILAIEEGEADFDEKMQAMDGLMSADNAGMVTTLNPTSIFSPISVRVTRNPGAWRQIGFPAYEVPNVILRREVIPGAVSYKRMDEALRSPDVEDRGPVGEKPIEKKKLDFVYALPDSGVPNKPGPREDGYPGHPDAVPHVWRPLTPVFAGQICDNWMREDDSEKLFHVNAILAQMSAGQWVTPEGPPDRVGVDCAGVRKGVATPSWGAPAREAIDAKAAARSITLGKTVEIHQGTGDSLARGKTSASSLEELYGLSPIYVFDQAFGGETAANLEARGAKVIMVSFVATPTEDPLSAHGKLKNNRAKLHVHAADAFNRGIVSAPYSKRVLDGMSAVGELVDTGHKDGKVLRPKEDMEKTTPMDELDSVVLSLDAPPRRSILIPVAIR